MERLELRRARGDLSRFVWRHPAADEELDDEANDLDGPLFTEPMVAALKDFGLTAEEVASNIRDLRSALVEDSS